MKDREKAWKWQLPGFLCVAALTLGCSTDPMGGGSNPEEEIKRLRSQNTRLVRENVRLSGENSAMQAHVAQLQERIRALEEKIDRLLAEGARERPSS